MPNLEVDKHLERLSTLTFIFKKINRSSEGGDSCGESNSEDPAGKNFPEETEALPAESVRLERIRVSLFDENNNL